MEKSVADKMGIKPLARTIWIDAPAQARWAIRGQRLRRETALRGGFDYIHLFATTLADVEQKFGRLKKHLNEGGMLWVSWPKRKKDKSDLTLYSIIKTGYDHGLVESKVVRIDAEWSAIKFTHPRKGKVYANSYGTLKL